MTDADLVARARRGDTSAFGELVERHQRAVFRAALAALGSAADADDVAQETFVTAYQRLASFRAESSFKTWLLTIAWHHAINRRRALTRWWRRTITGSPEGDAEWTIEPAADEPSPEQRAAGRQLRDAIAREIRALPRALRDTLLLAQAGDYSYEEIGTMLSAPIGTIKWRVSEARRRIKSGLAKQGFVDVG